MGDITRLSVMANAETIAALKEYAERHGVNMSEAVRRCVSLAVYIDGQSHDGHMVVLEKEGKRREVVFE